MGPCDKKVGLPICVCVCLSLSQVVLSLLKRWKCHSKAIEKGRPKTQGPVSGLIPSVPSELLVRKGRSAQLCLQNQKAPISSDCAPWNMKIGLPIFVYVLRTCPVA